MSPDWFSYATRKKMVAEESKPSIVLESDVPARYYFVDNEDGTGSPSRYSLAMFADMCFGKIRKVFANIGTHSGLCGEIRSGFELPPTDDEHPLYGR